MLNSIENRCHQPIQNHGSTNNAPNGRIPVMPGRDTALCHENKAWVGVAASGPVSFAASTGWRHAANEAQVSRDRYMAARRQRWYATSAGSRLSWRPTQNPATIASREQARQHISGSVARVRQRTSSAECNHPVRQRILTCS
jgi:hypothetical protein